jgi:hypothetical protein
VCLLDLTGQSLIYVSLIYVSKLSSNICILHFETIDGCFIYMLLQKVPCKVLPPDSCTYTDPDNNNCNVSVYQVINLLDN